jgi:threonine/homoserine/homoserine lactone efflux protein
VNGVIGDILPTALGIAISPIPIIAVILMLLSPRAKATSVGFLVGWVVGILAAVIVFTLLSSVIPQADASVSRPIAGVILIVLGLLLVLMAFGQIRSRPAPGETAKLPKWMGAVDSMTAGRAFVLGVVLSAVNPKNLLLVIAAGLTIGVAGLTIGETVITDAVFVVIAASTVLVPVIAYLVAAKRMAGPLDRVREWLVQHNAAVMAVVLFLMGVVVIGKGIATFQ